MSSEQEHEVIAPAPTADLKTETAEPVPAEEPKEEPVAVEATIDPPVEPVDETKTEEPVPKEEVVEKPAEDEKAPVDAKPSEKDAIDKLAAKTSELEVTA